MQVSDTMCLATVSTTMFKLRSASCTSTSCAPAPRHYGLLRSDAALSHVCRGLTDCLQSLCALSFKWSKKMKFGPSPHRFFGRDSEPT